MKYTIPVARFLLLTHIYPPAIDGGSRVIAKMGEYLESQNHHILVVTTNCQSTDDFTKKYKPLKHLPKNVLSFPVITYLHRPFKFLGRYFQNFRTISKGPIFSPFSFISALISILKFRPDYILAGPLPTTMVLYARLLRFLSTHLFHYSTKLIINASFHPTDPDFQTPILLNTLKSADYIWTLTDFETNYFNKKLNIPKSKLILLGNGVDKSFISTTPLLTTNLLNYSSTNLLFIGSFSAHKDIPTLIKAFSLLPPSYTLTLAGQKTLYFPVIQKQIDSLPLSIKNRIKIIFNFPNNYLSTLLDNSSLLISPSLQESFGLVLIEALARGKPVIAADIPASIEIITKTQSGLIFKAGNAIDLKNKILSIKLLNYSSTYLLNHFTWDKIGEKLCQKLHI
ncbi:MAG: glycosyltransferase family 4 protein [Candidatus Shapirobacteria bacterium]|nr:glycosyltransferase family 4 protein [Candidatus Shapirobacteria bacterium]